MPGMKKCFLALTLIAGLCLAIGLVALQYMKTTPIYKFYKAYNIASQVHKDTGDLQLTLEQKKLLKEIIDLLSRQGKTLNRGTTSLLDELVTQFQADRISQPKLNSLAGRTLMNVHDILPELFDKVAEFHATLTPMQKHKVIAMLNELR